ncbi:hypothetical protein [Mesomycoplasma ovipneumoniae]|uniref:hypothetical protein n=1 Tax=Mesomycoplasma ovipneumoniae TaxID=29562 RepID=UPI000AAFBA96|nr:hypothetical protein [Mesomycoplasma ovipneumoniae]WDV48876.1 hypothetical protein PWA39_01140 [Mesomycoplasma ovipneumoniae ATCC 29419]
MAIKKHFYKFLNGLAILPIFLISCSQPETETNVSSTPSIIIPISENKDEFQKQNPRSFDLYVSEVNAIRLKWFLNKPSLINLLPEEKSKIYASDVAKSFVFDNKNRILAFQDNFDSSEETNPNFLKNIFQKTSAVFSGKKINDQNTDLLIDSDQDNFEKHKKISKIFPQNWRYIETRLLKPNIIQKDNKNYLLINAYKFIFSSPITSSNSQTNEKTETKSDKKADKKWKISAPNIKPTPILRLFWHNQSLENPFKIKLNSKEDLNSEYDLQLINNIDQPESVADYSFNFSDLNPKIPENPLKISDTDPIFRVVIQSFAIPYPDSVANFESDNFKFDYEFD